jgi:NADPH-dependent glutamate synthase beta subunit-like oxidoreductase
MVPAQKKLTVAVVGGGPGGMEAARIATLRGHAVTIFEKTDEIGGAILRCCAVPGKNKMRWYADWLRHQVKKLGVTVRLSTSPTAADLAGFDAVVVATGSQTSRPAIPGINSSLVVPYENVLRCTRPACQYYPKGRGGPVAVGAKVLVWGDHFAAADTAEALALAGKEVCIVTAAREFAQWMEPCHREVMFKIFGGQPVEGLKTKPVAHPVKVFTRTTVTEIAADGTVTLLDAEFHKTTVKVDNVVLAAVEPAPSPYNELIAAGKVAECIGDLKEVRNLRAAVREGANIGLTLDEACRLNANRRMISALPTEVDLEARVVPAVAEVEMEEITVKD